MKYRKFANTNTKISRLSLGTWSLGGATPGNTSYGNISKKIAKNIIAKAFDLGVNLFDTSPTYGFSQKILGEYFKKKRDKIIFSSKVGLENYHEKKNFSKKFLNMQIYKILKELRTDYIDFIKLYNPDPLDENLLDGYDELKRLQEKGLIKNIGASLQSPLDLLKFNKNIKLDVIQCNFNLLDTRIINNKILNFAKSKNIGIIVRTIYSFGFFTEDFLKNKKFRLKLKKNDHRKRWSKIQINNWIKGLTEIKKNIVEKDKIENIATRFVNSFDFISSSLIGVQNLNELKNNLNNQNFLSLRKKSINKIVNINKKNIFIDNKTPKRII